MDIFINVMNAISSSWVWLGPLLVVCIGVMLVDAILDIFRGAKHEKDFRDFWE